MSAIRFDVNDPPVRDRFFRDQLGAAVAALQEGALPRWGAMTAQQMVEHLAWGFELSTGRAAVECTVPPERRERYKAFLRDNTPMMHEFRNPVLVGGLPPLQHPGLAEARAALAVAVGRFLDHERAAPGAVYNHPVFGPLTAEEWSRAHFKHAYHHLLQFGLIEEPSG
jgi:oxepin-CoA hydrolase / 3-oxo-5,6-dehydrosuberyl-CoA semialdehyde dehydrogenase